MRALVWLLAAQIAQAATVEGRVTSAAGNAPVVRAIVTLNGPGGPYTGETEANGAFRIEGVPAGKYLPLAQRRGFALPAKQLPDLFITEGEESVRLNFRLTPSAVISGRVLDADGDPLSRLVVQAMQYFYGPHFRQLQIKKSVTTNDRGEYRIYDLAPGRYLVRSGGALALTPGVMQVDLAPALGPAPTFYRDSTTAKSALPVDLSAGSELSGIDIHTHPQAAYNVQATVPAGGIVATVVQHLDDAESLGAYPSGVRDGVLQIRNLTPGSYVLTGQWTEQDGKQHGYIRQPFEIADRNVDLGTLKLIRGVDVTGTLQGPSTGVTLSLALATPNPTGHFNAVPTADGAFRFADAMPEIYWLRVMVRPGSYLKSIRSGGHEWSTQEVDLTRGAEAIAISLGTDGGEIAGLVTDAEGTPVNRAIVAIVPAQEGWPDRFKAFPTDAGGNFRIEDLAPGAYKVFAWEEVEAGAAANAEFRRPFESTAAAITVSADSNQRITLRAIPPTMGK